MSEETDTDAQIVDFKIDWNPSAAAAPAASFEETAPKVEPTDAAVASPKKAAGKNFTAKKAKKEKKNSRGKKTSKKKKLSSPSAKKKSATAVAETLQHQRRLPLDRHAKDPKIVAALRAMLFEDESAMTASLKNETSSKVVWSTYVTLKIRNKAKNGYGKKNVVKKFSFSSKSGKETCSTPPLPCASPQGSF